MGKFSLKRDTAKPAENETLKTFEEFFWTAQTLQHSNGEGDQRLAPGVPGSCRRDMASLWHGSTRRGAESVPFDARGPHP